MNKFNANFFIVVATVIPVLYLALTLQGPTYERLMTRWRSAVREGHRDRSFKSEARTVTAAIFAIGGAAVVLYSVYAEFLSLRALYSETANTATQRTVLQASVALLIMTAGGPAYAFVVAYVGTLVDDYRAARERRAKRLAAERARDNRAVEWMKRQNAAWQQRQAAQKAEQPSPDETDATRTSGD